MDQGIPQAIAWILMAAKKRRPKRTLAINLANELMDASKKLGAAFYKKEELYKIADTNIHSKNKKPTRLLSQSVPLREKVGPPELEKTL